MAEPKAVSACYQLKAILRTRVGCRFAPTFQAGPFASSLGMGSGPFESRVRARGELGRKDGGTVGGRGEAAEYGAAEVGVASTTSVRKLARASLESL